jgi:hypothetical protein
MMAVRPAPGQDRAAFVNFDYLAGYGLACGIAAIDKADPL